MSELGTYALVLAEVARRIDDLELCRDRVLITKVTDDGHRPSGLLLSWDTEKEGAGTNGQDDIGYPCILLWRGGTIGTRSDNMDFVTDFRQKVRREFHQRRIIVDDNSVAPLGAVVQYGPVGAGHGQVELTQAWRDRWESTMIAIVAWQRELREAIA